MSRSSPGGPGKRQRKPCTGAGKLQGTAGSQNDKQPRVAWCQQVEEGGERGGWKVRVKPDFEEPPETDI